MQVQVQTDNHIANREELDRYVASAVDDRIGRFRDQLTSVQVHLHDDTGPEKSSNDDYRCLMEARISGLKPVAVNGQADNMHQAIQGAIDKLERALDSTLGKLDDRKRHALGTGHLSPP